MKLTIIHCSSPFLSRNVLISAKMIWPYVISLPKTSSHPPKPRSVCLFYHLIKIYISRFTLVHFFIRRYNEAIIYYDKALAISTRSLSTYAGLAYTYHLQVFFYEFSYLHIISINWLWEYRFEHFFLQDNFTAAITYYHKVSSARFRTIMF